MQIIRVNDAQTWDSTLLALPNPHVLQSWRWGEFKSRYGWQATRVIFQEDGRTVAAASLLQRKLSFLPIVVCYVPKGPILDWTDTALSTRVLQELELVGRGTKALFVKIDPDIYYSDAAPAFSSRPGEADPIAHILKARGWRFSDDQIQYRNTALLDLRYSEEEILAAMKQKSRYNIRLATRRGVIVRQGTQADFDVFYQLYTQTSQRDGFLIRPPEYYYGVWGDFMQADQAHLLLAEVEQEIVAGLMLFTFGSTAWYMYGASSDRHRDKMPNNLLQWEAIRQAKTKGCTLYDLWGAPDRLDESDPMWGVFRFKLGMGGQLARGLGAWDFPVYRTGYHLYTDIMPRYLNWLRGRHRANSL